MAPYYRQHFTANPMALTPLSANDLEGSAILVTKTKTKIKMIHIYITKTKTRTIGCQKNENEIKTKMIDKKRNKN